MADQARADDLQERLVRFSVAVIRLTAKLPRTPAGKHVAGQLLRSGTSPAPNYAEARSAESRADFQHKLAIVLKELNESTIWLRVAGDSELVKPNGLVALLDENKQLCRIITASLRTSRSRGNNDNKDNNPPPPHQ